MNTSCSLSVPTAGVDLSRLVIEGNGKDLDMLLHRDGRPTLSLPLDGSRVCATDDVVLDVVPIGDLSLSLVYSAPGLLLTGARFSWTDSEFWSEAEDEIEKEFGILFSDTPRGSETRRETLHGVRVEVTLASSPATGTTRKSVWNERSTH